MIPRYPCSTPPNPARPSRLRLSAPRTSVRPKLQKHVQHGLRRQAPAHCRAQIPIQHPLKAIAGHVLEPCIDRHPHTRSPRFFGGECPGRFAVPDLRRARDDSTVARDDAQSRCEEVTAGTLEQHLDQGVDEIGALKKLTRAGMGLCQGQTCQQLVARILAGELGLSAADIDPTTARGPVRPLRLEVFANS